jgi:hypothetical protein
MQGAPMEVLAGLFARTPRETASDARDRRFTAYKERAVDPARQFLPR